MEILYDVHRIDIRKDGKFSDQYIKINPNSKIPAIVDHIGSDGQPITIMESGGILIYLAKKTGK